MGAGSGEIEADYMLTFANSCRLAKDSPMYEVLRSEGIASELTLVLGLEKNADLAKADLSKAAETYLKNQDMSVFDIWKLKARLRRNRPALAQPNSSGKISSIDESGSAVTTVDGKGFSRAGFRPGDMLALVFSNGFVLEAPYLTEASSVSGASFVFTAPGHTTLSISTNNGRFTGIAGLKTGDSFVIMRTDKAAYRGQ